MFLTAWSRRSSPSCARRYFQCGSVILLPMVLGLDGVWLSVTAAETAALVMTAALLAVNQQMYRY